MKPIDTQQLELALQNTSAPKRKVRSGQLVVDRAACPTVRPCPKFSCPHHLWVEDERRGRPHHGQSPPPKIVERKESCAIDLANHGEQTTDQVAGTMRITAERVNQIEDRALVKVAATSTIQQYVEDTLPKLPEGATLELVMPEQIDPHCVALVLLIRVDGKAWRRAQQQRGVFVRRKL